MEHLTNRNSIIKKDGTVVIKDEGTFLEIVCCGGNIYNKRINILYLGFKRNQVRDEGPILAVVNINCRGMNTEGMQGRFDKKDTEKNIKRVNIKVIIIIIKSMVTVKRID